MAVRGFTAALAAATVDSFIPTLCECELQEAMYGLRDCSSACCAVAWLLKQPAACFFFLSSKNCLLSTL